MTQTTLTYDLKAARTLFELGTSRLSSGRYLEAEAAFAEANRLCPGRISVLNNLANTQFRLGKLKQAKVYAVEALLIDSSNLDALFNLAMIEHQLGQHAEALQHVNVALSGSSGHNQLIRLQAEIFDRLGRLQDSLSAYERLLAVDADDNAAVCNAGAICNDLKLYKKAEYYNRRASVANPMNPRLMSNLALSLTGLESWDEALDLHQRALKLKPDDPELLANLGITLTKCGRHDEACTLLEQALQINPRSSSLWSNFAIALAGARQFPNALRCLDRARELDRSSPDILSSIAACYTLAGDSLSAYGYFKQYLEVCPGDAKSWNTFGDCCVDLKFYGEGVDAFSKALSLDGSVVHALGGRLFAEMFLHRWGAFSEDCIRVQSMALEGQFVVTPFAALALFDDPLAHLALARSVTSKHHPSRSLEDVPAASTTESHSTGSRSTLRCDRVKVGYFSADLKDHAVARLAIGLFEAHDHRLFEIYAFTLAPIPDSNFGVRLRACFDHVHDVTLVSDKEVALLSRSLGLDIAVDLSGFTAGCRPSIFSYRPAPICINFLGYPGTMASDYHDYVLCDTYVCPDTSERYFTEKLLRLERPYQPNDPTRAVSSRANYATCNTDGTGMRAFRFVCFNNGYKIHPESFHCWVQILLACPNSQLWLLDETDECRDQILENARAAGLGGGRICFAPRVALEDHLGRLSAADLFLDTWPYNAHTTASDALWAGLPVLTLPGKSFASRVAASFLHFCNLGDLICESQDEYIQKAIRLYGDPTWLSELRDRVGFRNVNLPLFDSSGYARDYESALLAVFERYRLGLPPISLKIAAVDQAK